MTLAAEAPDLDIFGNLKDPVFGFAHHRGFTHSFLGIALVAGVVVGFMYLIWRLRGRKTNHLNLPPRWGLLFLLAYLAGLSHILLDFTNNYGVRPFWPFVEKWYSWDIVFIWDPYIFLILIGGLALPALFGLINEEVGVRPTGPAGRLAATVALLAVVALWGARDFEHRRAVNAIEARTYENADPVRASAYPTWWTPFQWHGVVETQNFFADMLVDSLTPEVDPGGQMRVHYKPEETPASLAAKKSYLGRVFLDWAKYPIVETEHLDQPPGGYVVTFEDLRFAFPGKGGRPPLSCSVTLSENLNVVSESVGSRPRKR